jgi:alpha/beta superfamily hydrolase
MPEVILAGPDGRLEARYHAAEQKNAPVALVLHPHPLHGGTMNNKVAYNLYHSFVRNGFSVLRFNFRGVGRSQGTFDDGIGELSDAASALDWLQLQNPSASSFWIGGFSFGSWIGMQLLMRRPEVEGFIAVSPPAKGYDFSFLSPCPAEGLVVQGDQDSIVDVNDTTVLVNRLQAQKNSGIDYRIVEGADHFYRTTMEQLVGHIDDYLQSRLEENGGAQRKARPDRRRRQPVAVQ